MVLRIGSIGSALVIMAAAFPAQAQPTSFPLTFEHSLGEVTITEPPARVVALIDRDVDTLLALGIQPVAIRSQFGFPTGVGPWAEALLTTTPVVWGGRELNFEAIAAVEPDLIVFANSGGDAQEYDLLSQIAPTVYLPSGANPWEATTAQTTLLIAEAVGRRTDGEALLADLDAYLAQKRAEHPEFAGKTANYLDIYPGGIASYSDDHIVNGALYALGFVPTAQSVSVPNDQSSEMVSPELLPDYDADIVLVYPFDRNLEQLVAETPTLSALPSVEDGRLFLLDDLAFSAASVLSIPYALDRLVPQFSAALAR